MKRILSLLIIAVLATSLTGCGIKEKISQKISEKVTEKVVESTTGAKIDGDKVTLKAEDGTEVTIGGNEWPQSEIMKGVPKFEKGKISSVSSSDNMAIIFILEVEKEDYQNYIEKIKNDYTIDPVSMDFDDVTSYTGKNDAGITVTAAYNIEEKSISMSVSKE